MGERKQRRVQGPLDPAVTEFIKTFRRFPTGTELALLREAQASVALDKGDIGTYALDEE